jgi:DNA-binding response OmpR family regulator
MRRILLVDDEPHVIRVLRLALERKGYQVDSCSNGEQALARIHAELPDVLITDIDMPRMDGVELCRRISQEIPDRSFLITVLTGKTASEPRSLITELENIAFIEKPLSIRKLLTRLDGYFDQQGIH